MARPRIKKPLLQISFAIPEMTEDLVEVVFQKVLQRSPSIYTDAETGQTIASVFLENVSDWNVELKKRISGEFESLRSSGIEIGPPKIQVRKLKPEDWAESWKKHFKPIEIGSQLLIKPSWSKRKSKRGQACVVLDPGLSFGTGQHATTSFCLEQLVRCRGNEPQSFLDIGTGSGILSIAAAKLGYAPVHAFDFDPEAVRVSRENAKQNNVRGMVRPVRADLTQLPQQSRTKFDVVCANLIYDILISERKKIANRVQKSGSLILAGILQTQFAEVKLAFENLGMKLKASKVRKEWQSGHFVFQG